MRVRITIPMEPVSKENSRRVFKDKKGNPILAKSAKALAFANDCARILGPKTIHPLLEGDLVMVATLYYASQRPDLDHSLIMDVLQKVVYSNDRQVREYHVQHAIDKRNPRCEILIYPRQDMFDLDENQTQIFNAKAKSL